MRRYLLVAAIFGAASGAQAADMPDLPILRGAFTDGLTSKVNWQGFYIGGQGGFGTSDMNFINATQAVAAHLLVNTGIENFGGVSTWPVGSKVSTHGTGFGGFAGYNGQWEDVVLGVELNYMHTRFGATQTDSMGRIFTEGGGTVDSVTYQGTASMAIHDMGTLRVRAGYAAGSFLPYMFGGVSLGQADIIRTANIYGNQFPGGNFNVSLTDAQYSHLVYGYSAGLGLDVMLCAGLFLRAEWEYVRYTSAIDTNVNTVRVGLGYKF